MDARSAWDRFWKYDRLSSFGTGPGASNYAAPIAAGWRQFFASLPDGARILDLCTGNGAIAVMAVESASAEGKRFAIAGADLADVEPTAFVSRNLPELQQIRFLPNTPAEELPLPEASVDAVVSQYGIEYSDMIRSVPESVRVLAPGGRLRFAVHAAEGSVAADTRSAIADADFLLEEIDLTGRAARCFEAVLGAERASQPSSVGVLAARVRSAAFEDGLKALADRMAIAIDRAMLASVHHDLTESYQQRHDAELEALVAKADRLGDEIAAHRARQAALLDSALSAEEIAGLAETLKGLGMVEIAIGEQRDGGDLIAWTIEAKRGA